MFRLLRLVLRFFGAGSVGVQTVLKLKLEADLLVVSVDFW